MKIVEISKFEFEYKITFMYLIIGIFWILFSDRILDSIIPANEVNELGTYQSIKGVFYIIFTAVLLFYFVKRHFQKLKLSEEKYRRVVENIHESLIINDIEGRIIYANSEFSKMFGYLSDEYSNLSLRDYISDENINELVEIHKKRIQGIEVPDEFEYQGKKKDGTKILIEAKTSVIIENDRIIGTQSLLKDITDRKQAEHALQMSEEKYRKLSEDMPFYISTFLPDGTLTYVNEALSQLTGVKSEHLIGNNFLNFISPDNQRIVIEKLKLLSVENPSETHEQQFIISEDNYGFQQWTNRAFYDKDRNVIYYQAIGFDITERKLAEQALIESEKKYRNLFDNSEVGMFRTRLDGSEILEFNDKYLKMLNCSYEEVKGNPSINFWADKDERDKMVRILKEKGRISDFECSIVNKQGEILRCITSLKLYHDQGILEGSILDITERKQAEEALIIAKSKAEESDRLKTAFLQNISHEIRTPLNGIIGFSNLLQEENLSNDEIKEFTDIIQQSGKRLIEIVNNVLDISKIETGQLKVENKSFSINSLLNDLYSFFLPLAKGKDITLTCNKYYCDESGTIYSDNAKLNQILLNLINNAIKFTFSGKIDFGYEIKSNKAEFYVKDTGIGISSELHKKIFERFVQAEHNVSKAYQGAGLGLAISKGLVELLGGEIWVESEIDKGSSFFFTIPFNQTNINLNESNFHSVTEINNIKIKILIAEDDLTSFTYLSKVLKSDKFIILLANNGEEAVELVYNTPDIGLVLMDIRMPVMGGFEATKQIKTIRPDLPVIAQTAYAFSEEKERILSMGFDDYISKPIDKELLMHIINRITY